MATVGDAWVNIRASGDNLRSDIKKAMDSGVSAAESSGDKAGDAFGESFADSVGSSVKDALKAVVEDNGVYKITSDFGDAVGSSVKDAMQEAGSDAFDNIAANSSGVVDTINSSFDNINTSNLDNQANRSGGSLQELMLAAVSLGEILDGLGGGGGGRGGNFLDGLSSGSIIAVDSLYATRIAAQGVGDVLDNNRRGSGFFDWITNGASEARRWLDNLITTGNFLSAALFQLVGAIGALLASLFSIGSAVGAAVPSLIALGGVLASLIQGLVAFGIAWQGVSNAISQGLKTQTNAGKQAGRGARSQVSNARAIEAAQRALRNAYQRSAESASDAARRVSDAEADLADAQRESEQAQNALTAAREAGVESLQQLGFSAEEAALAEEGAAISLEKALGRLRAVQSLPPDSRTRREAELAFKEAELSYREAKDRNSDLAAEQEKAAQAGVEGTKEVTDAKNDIVDADNKVIESQQKLNDAIVEQQKAAAKAAQDIADAIRQLELAQQAAGSAAGAASGALNNYQTALSDLGPSQAEFVRFIVSLGPLFRTLKTAIGDGLFPPLTSALQELFKNTDSTSFFGMLKSSLSETGAIVGKFLASLVNLMNDPFFKGLFFDIIKNNNEVLKVLTGAFTDIAAALLVVFKAAGPVTKRFADWFGTLAKGWRDSATAPGALGKLTEFFNKAGDAASKVFGVLGSFFDMVMALGETALPAGITLLDNMTNTFKGLTDEIKGNKGGLTKYFNDAAENAGAVMDVLGDFGRVLFSFADNPGIKETAKAFKPLAPIIKQIGDAMIEAGPAFAEVAIAVGELVLQFVNSGQLEKFFNTFTNVLNFITGILKTGVGKQLILVLGLVAAIGIPLRVLGRIGKRVLIGELGYYLKSLSKLLGMFRNALTLTNIRLAISEVRFKIWYATQRAGEIATKLAAAATRVYAAAIRILSAAMRANPIGLIITAVIALVALFVILYKKNERFRNAIQALGRGAKKVFDKVVDAAKSVFDWVKKNWPILLTILLGPFGLLVTLVVKNWDKIKEVISVAIDKIVEIGARIWAWILPPLKAVWDAVRTYFTYVFNFWRAIIETFIGIGLIVWNFFLDGLRVIWGLVSAYFEFIFGVFRGIIETIVSIGTSVWNFFHDRIVAVWNLVTGFWNETIMPFINGIITVVTTAAGAVWDFISTRIRNVWTNATNFWNNTIYPFFSGIVTSIANVASGVWNFISDGLTSAWGRVTSFWDNTVMPFIRGLAGIISSGLGNLWGGLTSGLETAVNSAIGGLNLLIDGLNVIIKGMNYVKIGKKIDPIDRIAPVTFAAKGGIFMPKSGGNLAVIAEAGQPERVEPLDSQGLSRRDYGIMKEITGGGFARAGGGFTPAERAILQALSDNAEKEVNIQVFVGNQQIQDIVDVKMNGKSIRDARRTNYSRPVN